MSLPSAIWRTIRNPDICTVDDDGQIIECWPVDRREQWELSKPGWIHTVMTRELPCGCTRRWWGKFTLYSFDCWEHFRSDFPRDTFDDEATP